MATLNYDTTGVQAWEASAWDIVTLNVSVVSAPPSIDAAFEGWSPENATISGFEISQPLTFAEEELRQRYMEFADEDRALAEADLSEYHEMLRQNEQE